MTNTPGMNEQSSSANKPQVVVADTDAIIAQIFLEDSHHKKAQILGSKLAEAGALIIFPATCVAEAATTLQRKYSNPHLAAAVLETFSDPKMTVINIDQAILKEATEFFDPSASKRKTIFDCIVATLAKRYNADAIFSFEEWYTKLGFKLVSDLF